MLIRYTCAGCNRQWVIPSGGQAVSCPCGHRSESSCGPRYTRGFGDDVADFISWVLGVLHLRKPRKCGCAKRQRALNRLDKRVRRKLFAIATYLHPQ